MWHAIQVHQRAWDRGTAACQASYKHIVFIVRPKSYMGVGKLKTFFVLGLCIALTACVSQDKRLNNKSEDTLVSAKVLTMVEANDGTLDARDHDNVKCKRLRIVGSHRVTRFCYTSEEEKAMAQKAKDKYLDRFGPQKCLDRSSGACGGG